MMKAAQFFGKGDVRVVDVPKPQPALNEALIAIEWCGVCGSDLHEYTMGPFIIPSKAPHPMTGDTLPVTLGHEFCGRVVSAPSNSNLSPGQPVIVDPRIYCKSCMRCASGSTNACRSWGFYGLSGNGGGFSEFIAVDSTLCYPLPDSVDLRLAALIEPLAVAWHAVSIPDESDWGTKSVLILGGGPVGIAHIFVLKAQGAKKIFVSEPTVARGKQNRELADEVFNPVKEKVGNRCRELTGGEGVDVVFDCAGNQAGFNDGVDALRFKGIYVNVAAWEKPPAMPMVGFMLKELTMKFSLSYDDKNYRETVDAFVGGKFQGIETMVTSRIHVDDLPKKGFEELVTNKDDHIKILVTPQKDNLRG